ncbi:MAG: rhodanese-like domain-containing protein [Planctomycetes bacterium]|nr:rhodanese-like domain-containing protein [Planctomycetota bacterium]
MSRTACVLLVLAAVAVGACSGKYRRDFGGGEAVTRADPAARVLVLDDAGSAEISVWEGVVTFDLRDYQDWVQGHIPGARRLTLEDLNNGRGLPDDRDVPVMFMGDGPLDQRPEQAARAALERGHRNVQYFRGGWQAWTAGRTAR